MKNKFQDDLKNALNKNPELINFIFFTNVDLTPSEVENLKSHAFEKGIKNAEIFYREKIRQALDSPQCYGYRLQYLDIEMSKEEQASFIEILQSNNKKELIEIKEQNQVLDSKIARIEFLNELNRKFKTFRLKIELDSNYNPIDLQNFSALVSLIENL